MTEQTKYLDKSVADAASSYVNWKSFCKDNKLKETKESQSCYSPLTYNKIPNTITKISPYEKLENIPYPQEIIQKWINEITELGFPVELNIEEGVAYFNLYLDKFEYKAHLTSTLQLTRCLFETGICYVPECYFKLLDEKPEVSLDEKFELLQLAHAAAQDIANAPLPEDKNKEYAYRCNFNWNHTVTYKENFVEPMPRKLFWEKLKQTEVKTFGEYKYVSVSNLWSNKNK